MILEEKYREIINKMTKIVLVDVKAYFTDFTSFDIPQLCELVKEYEAITGEEPPEEWQTIAKKFESVFTSSGIDIDNILR